MAVFLKKHTRSGQLFPAPEPNETVRENPPVFSWLAAGKHSYTVTVRDSTGGIVWQTETAQAAAVPDRLFAPGKYTWDVTAEGESRGVQSFTVPEDAIEFLRPTADEILAAVPAGHPRHLFTREEIPEILATHEKELEVLRRNIAQAYKDGLPEAPRYHRDPDALPYREYFGRYRDYCDRNLVALALGYTCWGMKKPVLLPENCF